MGKEEHQGMDMLHKSCTGAASIVFILLVLFLPSCTTKGEKQEERRIFWESSTPEEQGMDSAALTEIFEYIAEQDKDVHSLLVVRNGHIVLEAYYPPYTWDRKHIINSCTKSFLSALAGIAVDQGYIHDTNARVLDYFPEYDIADGDELKQKIEIGHLLTMTSGIDWPQHGRNNISDRMVWSRDWIGFILDRPMAADPGSRSNYSNGDSHLLSAIIQRTTGKSALEFGWEVLFRPLGIADVRWDYDPQGINIGSATMYIIPRDMAKLGYLYLNGGMWEGESIIPSAWVDRSFQSHTKIETAGGAADYGYFWWIYPERGLYEAWGGQGQRIGIFPDLNIVAVMTSDITEDKPRSPFFSGIYDFIIESAKSTNALPENPEALAELERRIEAAQEN